ncbi:multifunctional CCA tRNA nucleotidyl transferase/2'3'-cyclic phosphodiesterase/2'nucleotidase/phosphatase [Acidihalobacter yilgarnensis]|uniref:Multifunctional CCA protein n=1 Tax=Acidihalobacter yilgarnensis TaxID=2819280 RepID=A0A1D8IT16_9GAMM|nr:multifunctional CCA addition/repair protein [Acidihalobacter yilgarnensis]AOU99484.1 multifunctional CCA tRNA nucleotidyl transferase/2'3'-cyclic phosphodiesterase/2'nucleotidase/phosphatase [Acidihalobacter yilgarnensis]
MPDEIYLVGGAVRDGLLGLPIKERDWVVVGSTTEQMLRLGFKQVGKDFPVFLHPDTGEEYALARTERKTAAGYHGFAVHAAPDVTLEEDLRRRDLTINAIARRADGSLVDPYGGRQDLDQRVLRHVSPAFAEDPVRILRVARFAARLVPLGFRIADETLALMRDMTAAGEVDALVPERVWQELVRALAAPAPESFFETLRTCGALAKLVPELDRLWGVPQPPQWHPEIDTGVHTMLVLQQAARLSSEPLVRFAALVHDLGKGLTPPGEWPSHRGHEARGERLVTALCARLKVPNDFRDLARLTAREHGNVHKVLVMRADTILKLLEGVDAFRRPERFEQFLLACEADARGRPGFEAKAYPQPDFLRAALAAARAVPVQPLIVQGHAGSQLAEHLHRARAAAITLLPRPNTE